MNWSKFSQAGGTPGTPSLQSGIEGSDPFYQKAGDAIYQQFSNRAEPQFQRDTAATETQLRNQGLKPGDEAYDQQIKQLRQSQGDARQQASLAATQGAGAEAGRMQGMDIGAAGFGNSAKTNQFNLGMAQSNAMTQQRQQQIAEEMQKRGFSLNEINALISGQQVGLPGMPSFNQANKADTTQYMTAAQNQYGAAQDQSNAQNATIGGIAKLAGSAAMFSDRRLKFNITPLGIYRGIKLYFFTYIWGIPAIGVMSDEIDQKHVIKHSSGYDMVNYATLFGEF